MTPRIPSVGDIERDYTKNASLGMEGRFAVLRSAQLIFELFDALSLGLFLRAFGIIFFAAFLTAALADLTMISSSIS